MLTPTSVGMLLIIYLILKDQPEAAQAFNESRLESKMHQMAKDLENPSNGVSLALSNGIVKEFINLGKYVSKETKDSLHRINVTKGQSVSIYFDFTPKKRKVKRI